jgi:hypothetical protein
MRAAAVHPSMALPSNGGTIVISWPATAAPVQRPARPSSFRPATRIVRAGRSILPRPATLAHRRFIPSDNTLSLVSPSQPALSGLFGIGPSFFGNPLFCDRSGLFLFGFSPFFFGSGFCPFCFPSTLGLPLLSVNGLGFGFGPPFFLPFGNGPFFGPSHFGPPFFRHRFFGSGFFGAPFFFPGFVTGVETEEVASAPTEAEQPDPAIIPSNQVWGGPSDAESMAAAPSESHAGTTLLVLKNGSIYSVVDYWLGEDWRVHYVTTYGGENSVPLDQVDVLKSMQVNMARGKNFILDSGPRATRR